MRDDDEVPDKTGVITTGDSSGGLAARLAQLEDANAELMRLVETMQRNPIHVPTLEAAAAAKAHAMTADAIPNAPTTERPDEVLAQRVRDLDAAATLAERRAVAAQRTLAHEPPQLRLEFFAPDELGGVGWRLSLVGAAERVDRALLLVETLIPAYDRLMELIEEGHEAQDRRKHRRRMAK